MKNLTLIFALILSCNCIASAFQIPVRDTIIDDFEQEELVVGTDGNGLSIGYYLFSGAPGSIKIGLTNAPPALRPGSDMTNKVLADTMTLTNFAVYIHNFTNESVDAWIPKDWSSYEGIELWIYGRNTGNNLFLDILDNRNPGSTTDDAERWVVNFPDDFFGWQFFQFGWDEFSRKEIGNGAPNDGLTLTQVYGYALGGVNEGNIDANIYYVDNVANWGNREVVIPLEVQFSTNQSEVTEGETAQIEVELNVASDVPVSIMYKTAESTAVPARDFIPVGNGMVTIPAGSTSASFPIITIDNNKYNGDRSLMIVLSEVSGAEFGFLRKTRLTILDDDLPEPLLIDDFERCHPFQTMGEISAEAIEMASGVPCQGSFEYVVAASGNGTLARTFVESQDWSSATGLSFWFKGIGGGDVISIEVLDNRSTTTAATAPGDWVLVWSDEFNDPAGTAPNPNTWKHDLGDGSLNGTLGWGNAESQYYTNDLGNAATDGAGNMVISIQELDPNTTDLVCYYGPCEYTSARLLTKNKISFEYGRIETRIQVPSGEEGLWPAFWALGTDIDEVAWPQAGEIDIMEYVSRLPNQIFGTIHGPGYSGGSSFGDIYNFGQRVDLDYHTFTIEWRPDDIKWFVDGFGYHQAIPNDVAPNEWVFNHPFFLLLNMAIGGNFGGPISDQLIFPQEMKIDYVRVYQASESAEHFQTTFLDDKSGWQLIYLPFSDFTRSIIQPDGAPNDGLGLNEVWGYNISLPAGAANNGNVFFDQVRLESDGAPEFPCQVIPALGEWGLFSLTLLFFIFGSLTVRKWMLSAL